MCELAPTRLEEARTRDFHNHALADNLISVKGYGKNIYINLDITPDVNSLDIHKEYYDTVFGLWMNIRRPDLNLRNDVLSNSN